MRPLFSRRRSIYVGVALTVVLAALLALAGWTHDATSITGTPDRIPSASSTPEFADNGMVVSARREASEAGVEMLRKGGNAVDAAVATGFALAVVYPSSGNIGGGGFMVIRMADGTVTTIDHRETAPAGATQEVFLDEEGNAAPRRSRVGALASGVPGTVHGLLSALKKYGTLSREEVMGPAIRMAEEGIPLPYGVAQRFNNYRDDFSAFESTRTYFTKADSAKRYRAGERWRQPDLAETLTRIRDHGIDGFYDGRTAQQIVDQMDKLGGLIDREDLRNYTSVEREPVSMNYRGYTLHAMGPPSSGGVALAQLLHAAEAKDLKAMGYQSSSTVHYLGEAMKRTFADRAKWLGDPDFVDIPTEELTDSAYVAKRMATFDPDRITPTDSVSAGQPAVADESMETNHYSVVDDNGMAVSVTTTLNSSYGSKVVVDGAGFFLNNEMNDFVLKPGVPNQFGLSGSERNLVAPGRRMVSSMTPTIVEDAHGRLHLVIGAPGGSTIITTVFQVITNVIDYGMDIEQAVTAGRIHHQWRPETLHHERYTLPADVVENLETRGWVVKEGIFGYDTWGRAHGIRARYPSDRKGEQEYFGGADPRRSGAAVGY
ncbi:gamma-glutamyltransferase [Longibacter salinarum]|uniref:Glutathione hydrolase proenzyme n=1 Tax=Longibacter salinarum TaxID=1850348 RepID=A0A2A8CU16_9BACT|nr:gamma-glutamyltransferase [Longibacter salinarum]PEN11227.1 gamma-glutamyltransferase [Longibacter salinarum]